MVGNPCKMWTKPRRYRTEETTSDLPALALRILACLLAAEQPSVGAVVYRSVTRHIQIPSTKGRNQELRIFKHSQNGLSNLGASFTTYLDIHAPIRVVSTKAPKTSCWTIQPWTCLHCNARQVANLFEMKIRYRSTGDTRLNMAGTSGTIRGLQSMLLRWACMEMTAGITSQGKNLWF